MQIENITIAPAASRALSQTARQIKRRAARALARAMRQADPVVASGISNERIEAQWALVSKAAETGKPVARNILVADLDAEAMRDAVLKHTARYCTIAIKPRFGRILVSF